MQNRVLEISPQKTTLISFYAVEGTSPFFQVPVQRSLVKKILENYPNDTLIPTRNLFLDPQDSGQIRILKERKILYFDDDHLSQEGALLLYHRLKMEIEK